MLACLMKGTLLACTQSRRGAGRAVEAQPSGRCCTRPLQMLLFFAGMLIRWTDIPNYWRWFSYIDVLR